MRMWDLYGEHQLANKYASEHFGPGSVKFDSCVLLYILGWLKIFTIFICLKHQPSFLQWVVFCPLYSKTTIINLEKQKQATQAYYLYSIWEILS